MKMVIAPCCAPVPVLSRPHGAFFLPYIQLDFFFLQLAPCPFAVHLYEVCLSACLLCHSPHRQDSRRLHRIPLKFICMWPVLDNS